MALLCNETTTPASASLTAAQREHLRFGRDRLCGPIIVIRCRPVCQDCEGNGDLFLVLGRIAIRAVYMREFLAQSAPANRTFVVSRLLLLSIEEEFCDGLLTI